jgi:hypothetical protein
MGRANPATAVDLGVSHTAISILASVHSVVRNALALSIAMAVGSENGRQASRPHCTRYHMPTKRGVAAIDRRTHKTEQRARRLRPPSGPAGRLAVPSGVGVDGVSSMSSRAPDITRPILFMDNLSWSRVPNPRLNHERQNESDLDHTQGLRRRRSGRCPPLRTTRRGWQAGIMKTRGNAGRAGAVLRRQRSHVRIVSGAPIKSGAS